VNNVEKEQAKIVDALKFAIQMEIDGKEFYQKSEGSSSTKLGKELFHWLAGEEDKHRQRFEHIYQSIKKNQAWPDADIQPAKSDKLKTIFSSAKAASTPPTEDQSAELKSIAKSMDMEQKSQEFYQGQGALATYPVERTFFNALAAEENGHYLALVDYREYLVDPAGWFRKSEHHSLDGA
jgi:rubrerythrin